MLAEKLSSLGYVIVLCDDLERMKVFYRELLAFTVVHETETGLTFQAGSSFLGLRKRTRRYDHPAAASAAPGVQLAFLVEREAVDRHYRDLVSSGVEIVDPPADQPWGHRTVYFTDPEGNLLEIYAELAARG